MAIQKPTNPTEALFAGFELGSKVGSGIAAAAQDRADRKQYAEVAAQAEREIAALDNEDNLAKQTLEGYMEKLKRNEFVSQKEMASAIYASTAGGADRLNKRIDILSGYAVKFGTNKYVRANFGKAAEQIFRQGQESYAQMEKGLNAMSQAVGMDIRAYRADTERTLGQERADLGRAELEELERHRREQERQGRAGLQFRGEEMGLKRRAQDLDEQQQSFVERMGERKMSLDEAKFANMNFGQSVSALKELTVLVDKADEFGIPLQKVADVFNQNASSDSQRITPELLGGLRGTYNTYDKATRQELRNIDRRIADATARYKAGDAQAADDLQFEQKQRQIIIEADRAAREVQAESARYDTLDAVNRMNWDLAAKFGGATRTMADLVKFRAIESFGSGWQAGQEGGVAERAIKRADQKE